MALAPRWRHSRFGFPTLPIRRTRAMRPTTVDHVRSCRVPPEIRSHGHPGDVVAGRRRHARPERVPAALAHGPPAAANGHATGRRPAVDSGRPRSTTCRKGETPMKYLCLGYYDEKKF